MPLRKRAIMHLSVMINDLGGLGAVRGPYEADPPMVLDVNTVLTHAITAHGFQSVAWRGPQGVQRCCRVEQEQFALIERTDVDESLCAASLEQGLGVRALE